MTEASVRERVSTVDEAEIARFSAIADQWWDPTGKFRPLHQINPLRIAFIKEEICRQFGRDPFHFDCISGLRILDIGCGGGLLTEPIARLGGAVVGADASATNIAVAKLHAERAGLPIDYRATTAEDLAAAGERFDLVLALEVVEHVPDPAAFIALCAELVNPGGLMVVSTINRTMKAYALAIVGAEYILRWLPRGTHQWKRFVTPDELTAAFAAGGLTPGRKTGMVYAPLGGFWRLNAADTDVNYLMSAARPAS
ncbi:MAG: bifunctional 2-polyprenyl-6-hydroxyphenol methylase/3-demethylubiquinol 3-O-methyltransferase UbiG [Bauldia sp.]|nr:bifunctional 2-polyprenyl-6-hydroxyphenol methylase/3-demethylubiquinol 3-O-methyltransferase UbiG [Bauldia sp.]